MLIAEPFVLYLVAEIRRPLLLPHIDDADGFGDFEIPGIRGKARSPIHSTVPYERQCIRSWRIGKVAEIRNLFEMAIMVSKILIPLAGILHPGLPTNFRHQLCMVVQSGAKSATNAVI